MLLLHFAAAYCAVFIWGQIACLFSLSLSLSLSVQNGEDEGGREGGGKGQYKENWEASCLLIANSMLGPRCFKLFSD